MVLIHSPLSPQTMTTKKRRTPPKSPNRQATGNAPSDWEALNARAKRFYANQAFYGGFGGHTRRSIQVEVSVPCVRSEQPCPMCDVPCDIQRETRVASDLESLNDNEREMERVD